MFYIIVNIESAEWVEWRGEGFLDGHVNKQANTVCLMDVGGVCLVMGVRLCAHAEQKLGDSSASWWFSVMVFYKS